MLQLSELERLQIIAGLVVLVVSEVLHEMLRARVADRFGDPTPREADRITWNPLPFIDPLTTLIFPAIALYFTRGALVFGGAKPTPVREDRMRRPRLGGFITHGVGPLANLAVAALCAALLKSLELRERGFLAVLLKQGVFLNAFLVVFHYLPLPGTNSGQMIRALLPPAGKRFMDAAQSYVFPLLLLLIIASPDFRSLLLHFVYKVRRLID